MLQTQTVETKALELLRLLMCDEKLGHFHLVGGTALALYIGHRRSIDLDLFSQQLFDVEEMKSHLTHAYGFQTDRQSDATLIGHINFVKVDCIRYLYPLVKPLHHSDGIRMYSIPDIAAMKLTAVSQSGRRLKDFVDIAFLSTRMSLEEMLDAFEKKYPKTNVMTAVRGLSFFDEIDFSVGIDLIHGSFHWKIIEKRLKEMIKYSDKIFPQMFF